MNGSMVSKAGESGECLSCGFKHILPEGGVRMEGRALWSLGRP